jgi:SAM-dependent methyltransferase
MTIAAASPAVPNTATRQRRRRRTLAESAGGTSADYSPGTLRFKAECAWIASSLPFDSRPPCLPQYSPIMSVQRFLLVLTMTAAAAGAQTPDIHYVPTSGGVTDAMLKLAHVTSDDVVYDLGSGDGRIVIAAAKKYGARGVGIEIDANLIKEANRNAQKAGVADRVKFVQGDLFKTDLSEATVVTLYLSNSINRRIASILQKQLKPGSRVVSHRFDMGDWKPEADVRLEGTHVYLWTIK